MQVYLIILLTVLTHTSFKGSRVLITLYAIDLGADPFTLGVLFSMYSLFPMFLSVYAGKLSDRLGARRPMLFGAFGLMAGLILPYFMPRIEGLFLSATLIGMCYIFFTVSVQHLIGSFGDGIQRTRNYGLFAMGIGVTALIGPTTTGFAIDLVGHRTTYLLLALLPAVPIVALLLIGGSMPKTRAAAEGRHQQRLMDLVRIVPLRRALITAGIIETGLELSNFFLPIYSHSIGFSASQIGLVMGAFAVALLLVRTVMPMLVRRSSEEWVLSASLLLAAATSMLFPFVSSFVLMLAMSFVLGMGLGCCSPLSMILAYNRSPAGRSGEAMGLRQTVNKATEVAVPVIFGSVGTAFGMFPVFWLVTLMLAFGGWLMRKDARGRADGTRRRAADSLSTPDSAGQDSRV